MPEASCRHIYQALAARKRGLLCAQDRPAMQGICRCNHARQTSALQLHGGHNHPQITPPESRKKYSDTDEHEPRGYRLAKFGAECPRVRCTCRHRRNGGAGTLGQARGLRATHTNAALAARPYAGKLQQRAILSGPRHAARCLSTQMRQWHGEAVARHYHLPVQRHSSFEGGHKSDAIAQSTIFRRLPTTFANLSASQTRLDSSRLRTGTGTW